MLAFDFVRFDAVIRLVLRYMGLENVSPQSDFMFAPSPIPFHYVSFVWQGEGKIWEQTKQQEQDFFYIITILYRSEPGSSNMTTLDIDTLRAFVPFPTSPMPNHCNQGDLVFVIMGKQFMMKTVNVRRANAFILGENAFHKDENVAASQRAALIEVADLYISVDDGDVKVKSHI